MKKLLCIIMLLVLSACASPGGQSTAQQKVFAAHQAYNTALAIAVAYKNLPPCGAGPVLCSDKAVVTTIQKADVVAFEALSAAQRVVRTTTSTESSIQAAITWATEAVSAFVKVTSNLKTSMKGATVWAHLHTQRSYWAAYQPWHRPASLCMTCSSPGTKSWSSFLLKSGTPLQPSGMS